MGDTEEEMDPEVSLLSTLKKEVEDYDLPQELQVLETKRLSVTELQDVFGRAKFYEEMIKNLKVEIKTLIVSMEEAINENVNNVSGFIDLKEDLDKIYSEIEKPVVDWPGVIGKLTLLYQQFKAGASSWSSNIATALSNLFNKTPITEASRAALPKNEIDEKIYVFFDELEKLVNSKVENKEFDAGNLCVQIKYLQKEPELTEVQHAALKRLQKETHAIEKGGKVGVKTEVEAKEEDRREAFKEKKQQLAEQLERNLHSPGLDEEEKGLDFWGDG